MNIRSTSCPWLTKTDFDPTFAGYIHKVLITGGANTIGVWLQNEKSGSVAYDLSGNNHHGAYTGVTLGQPGVPGMEYTSLLSDGATSFNNIHSLELAAAFNGSQGTLITWNRIINPAIWVDAVTRRTAMLYVDDNNYIAIEKRNIDNTLRLLYVAGGVLESTSFEVRPSLEWIPYAISWNKLDDEQSVYCAGIQSGFTRDTLGVWAGVLNANLTCLCASSVAPAGVWSGLAGPAILYNRALSYELIAYLSNHNPRPAVVISLDDGHTSVYTIVYPLMVARGIRGTAYIVSSTVGGGGILTIAQLQELDAAGWDIGNHSDTHTNLTTLNLAQQTAELEDCRTALDGWGLTRASGHIAYPGGAENADTQTAMTNLGMITGRKVIGRRLNRLTCNLYKIPAQNINVLADIIAQTQAALDGGQTFVYYAHDIDGGVDLSAADFESWLDWLVVNDVETLTISELYNRMTND